MRPHLAVDERAGGRDPLPDVVGQLSACVASRSAIGAGRFFRKPDFQFRDFGASAPDVSFNQKVASSFATHPVIVTDVAV